MALQKVTESVIRFVLDTTYEDLPDEVVHEVKRSLLDAIGAALTGPETERERWRCMWPQGWAERRNPP